MGLFRCALISLAISLVACLLTGGAATAASGDRDLTFGENGQVRIDTTRPTVDVANAIAAGGTDPMTVVGAVDDRMAVARYTPSGEATSFGGDGLVTADFGVPAVAHGVLSLGDGAMAVGQAGGNLAFADFDRAGHPEVMFGRSGRLVVPLGGESMGEAGTSEGMVAGWVVRNGHRDVLLAQLYRGGLDTTFNGSGTKIIDLAPGADDAAFSVADYRYGPGVYVGGHVGGDAMVARFVNGSLDPSFGVGGKVVFALTSGSDVTRAMRVDYDTGDVLVAGEAGSRAFVARITLDGALVPTFGGGVVQFDLGGTSDVANGVAVRPDGMVFVSGTRTTPSGTDGAARRFTGTGLVDPTFGDAGLVTADFGTASDRANSVAVQPDGRFVLAGNKGSDMVLAAFTSGGATDTSFGTDGTVVRDEGAPASELGDVVRLYPDGRSLALGTVGGQLLLARRLPDGRPDPSFGEGGVVTHDYGGGGAMDAAIRPDGRILVLVGMADANGNSAGHLASYLANGARDMSFGTDGEGPRINDPGNHSAMALLADGRIRVAAKTWDAYNTVAGFLATGWPDPTFGENGLAIAGYLGPGGALGVQSDGTIILAVQARAAYATVYLERFSPDGVRDESFAGRTLNGVGGPPVVEVLPDDRLYVAGSVYPATHPETTGAMTIARLRRDGHPDATFGSGGLVRLDLGADETLSDIALDGQFLAVVGGSSQGDAMSKATVVRLTSNGALDTQFGSGGVATFSDLFYFRGVARGGDGKLVLASTLPGPPHSDLSLTRLQPGTATSPSPPTSTSAPPTAQPAPAPPTTAPATTSPRPGTTPPPPIAVSRRSGYWMVSRTGATYAFGEAGYFGNAPTASTVDIEPTPSGRGYWIVNASGSVYSFGDARYLGGANGRGLASGEEITSLSGTPAGAGYWLFTTHGRVIPFGDASFRGDMGGMKLNGPVLDSVATPSGLGYYLVASDGGIFAFGDARFRGSMGGKRLNAPVQSLVPDGDGLGYWLVASDGGVFAFDAPFRGSMGAARLNQPVTGMVSFGNGYLMVGEDGGIFNFSDKPFLGSLGSNPPPSPIVAVAPLDHQ